MTKAAIQQIKELASELDEDDLRQLETYISRFKAVAAAKGQLSTDAVVFYQAISHEIAHVTAKTPPPLAVLLKNSKELSKLFERAHEDYKEWLDSVAQRPLTKTEKQIMGRLAAQLVVEHLEKWRVPVHLKTVLNKFKDVGSIFNRQFPGYVESGFFHALLEAAKGEPGIHFDGVH